MRFALSTLLLMLAIGPVSFADSMDVGGNWTVKYVGGPVTKTMGGAEFELKADGDKLTGIANVGVGHAAPCFRSRSTAHRGSDA